MRITSPEADNMCRVSILCEGKKMSSNKLISAPKSFFEGKKLPLWFAAGLAILVAIALSVFLMSLAQQTKYYVLTKAVDARTLITPDMLEEVPTNLGGEPPTALTMEEVATNELYAKTKLNPGDIITQSNAGELSPLSAGLPDDFVIASFTANANSAAGGNIQRGDYIDIFVTSNEEANLIFQRVLVVETAKDLAATEPDDTITATEDTPTAPYRMGVPELYTVGVTQADAAKLALASQQSLYIVLSSPESVENGVQPVSLGISLSDLLAGEAGDSGEGTDHFFRSAEEIANDKSNDKTTKAEEEENSEEPTNEETTPPTDEVVTPPVDDLQVEVEPVPES